MWFTKASRRKLGLRLQTRTAALASTSVLSSRKFVDPLKTLWIRSNLLQRFRSLLGVSLFHSSVLKHRSSSSNVVSAHYGAWRAAHVLHRDVSVGNILILDQNPEGPPDPKTSKGLLSDWDLAITKDELDADPVFPHKTRAVRIEHFERFSFRPPLTTGH